MGLTPEELGRITNAAFANHVLAGSESGKPFFSCFSHDPSNAGVKGFPRTDVSEGDTNNFFCVSRLSGDRRIPNNFCSLHVIVVDDVGTKIESLSVEATLGLPSYKIETSPGNEQWGYVLDPPILDRCDAVGLVNAAARKFTGDVAGINRLVRLPVGANSKAKYGRPYPRTKLTHLDPSRTFTSEQLSLELGAIPEDFVQHSDVPFLPADRDPVVAALANAGLDPEETRDPGKYKITCPWVDSHTDQRDDGSVYIAPHGFNCFHGHCGDKNFADLRRFLNLTDRQIDDVSAQAFAESLVNAPPVSVVPTIKYDRESHIQTMAYEWEHSGFGNYFDGLRFKWELVPEPDYLFDGLIEMNEPWFACGEEGIGKSRLGLALAMSVATGRPFGGFVPNPEGGRVIFLTHEDGRGSVLRRIGRQFEKWHREEPWTLRDKERLSSNLKMPVLAYGQPADEGVQAVVAQMREWGGDHILVLYDPLIAFWDEGERGENSINSAAGAIHTFIKLIDIASQHQARWSMGFLHHLNKEGGVYGSKMIRTQARGVFDMTLETDGAGEDERELVKVVLSKANNVKRGKTLLFELDGQGALWPTTAVRNADPVALVATRIRSVGRGDRDSLLEWSGRNPSFGEDHDTRCAVVLEVLQRWAKGDDEALVELGIIKAALCTTAKPSFIADDAWGLGPNAKPEAK